MGRLLAIPEGFDKYNFITLMKREANGRRRIKLLAMHHLQSGKSLEQTAEAIQSCYKTVQTWLRIMRNEGLAGLCGSKYKGAPMKFSYEIQQWLNDTVNHLSTSKVGGHITGKEIQIIINERFNTKCCLRTVYNYLHRLNYSWITSRSIHPKANLDVQEAYKKTLVEFY